MRQHALEGGDAMTYRHPHRCERNMAGREEDCGSRITYVRCGEPAHWCIEDSWWACEEHTLEFLRESDSNAVTGIDSDDPVEVVVGDDGELRVAS